jgi:hypothetical protein
MLSAAPYPIVLYGSLRLPPILPQNPALYASLRQLHTDFAYLLFAVFLAHLGAALLHGLIRRDGVFESMALWGRRRKAVYPSHRFSLLLDVCGNTDRSRPHTPNLEADFRHRRTTPITFGIPVASQVPVTNKSTCLCATKAEVSNAREPLRVAGSRIAYPVLSGQCPGLSTTSFTVNWTTSPLTLFSPSEVIVTLRFHPDARTIDCKPTATTAAMIIVKECDFINLPPGKGRNLRRAQGIVNTC